MTEISDTHRRAKLRSRESVARWRIQSGVWAGRLYTVLFAVATILPLIRREGPDWSGAAILALLAGALLFATEWMRRGSRFAACALLGLFVLGRLGAWLVAGQPVWNGLLWTIIIGGALANATSGTFALAAVRRDAALVTPAPPRSAPARPPTADGA